MIPRGVVYAASVAVNPFQQLLPEPASNAGRPGNLDKRETGPVEKSGKQSDFARRLDREVDRRDKPHGEQDRSRVKSREGERTKESSLVRKKEPDAVLSREKPEPVKEGEDVKKNEAANENPVVRLENADQQIDPQVTLKILIAAIEDWLLKNLEELKTGLQKIDSGPGGSKGFSEDQLGPRFAIKAPHASLIESGIIDLTKSSLAAEILTPEVEVGDKAIGGKPDAASRHFIASGNAPRFNIHISKADTIVADNLISKADTIVADNLTRVNAESGEAVTRDSADGSQGKIAMDPSIFRGLKINADEISRPWWKVGGQENVRERSVNRIDAARLSDAQVIPNKTDGILTRLAELICRAERVIAQKSAVPLPEVTLETQPVTGARMPVQMNIQQPLNTSTPQVPVPVIKAEGPVFVEEIQRVVQDLGRESIMSVRFRLHPPELGQLVIEFRRDENGMRIEFHTQHPAVQKIIEDAGPKMIEKLAGMGVDIGSLDVSVGHGKGEEQGTTSPLDNPGNRPTQENLGNVDGNDLPGTEGSGQILYLKDRSSTIDMLM